MLKRIDISDLELGMFVHKLEGSWFKHPFWKSQFLLTDERTLDSLLTSAVPAVVIDTARGLDVRPAPSRGQSAAHSGGVTEMVRGRTRRAPIAPRVVSQASDPDSTNTQPQTLSREFGTARQIAERSRKMISRVFLEARLGKSINASALAPVVDDIFASVQRNPHAFNGLMRCKRDYEFVYRHSLAVSALMISLARQMKLTADGTRQAGMAGLLIDLGVSHLPADLASLGGDFRRIDDEVFSEHARLGHDLLTASGLDECVARAAFEHHERMDGSGYPRGLKGEQIGRLGRMAAICDTYDWLVNDTLVGAGLDPAAAIAQLRSLVTFFDPKILRAFVDALGIHPVGSLVELSCGRLAMVMQQEPATPTRPRVRTFWHVAERRIAPIEEIVLAECGDDQRILGTAVPEDYGCTCFPEIREKLFAMRSRAG